MVPVRPDADSPSLNLPGILWYVQRCDPDDESAARSNQEEGAKMAVLKAGEYQAALKMLTAADAALQHALSGVRNKENSTTLRRRIEDVEGFIKKAKRAMKLA